MFEAWQIVLLTTDPSPISDQFYAANSILFYSSVSGGGGSLIGGLDSYSETLSRHKAVLDDLHDLSRPLRPLSSSSSPSILTHSGTHHNDVIESFIPRPGTLREISAYVLQHQQLADPVQVHFNCFHSLILKL